MTDGYLETRFISQLLQFRLPQTTPCAVTPPTIRGEQQFRGVGIGDTAHPEPPLPECRYRKLRRIMGGAYTHPPRVGCHIINAIRNALASGEARKIIRLDFFGPPLGLILPALIGQGAYQLFLFGIHGDHRLVPLLERLDPGIDIGKLGITIRVRLPFVSLARTLETIAESFEELPNFGMTDVEALRVQFCLKLARTFTRPAQGGDGIPAGGGFDKGIERLQDALLLRRQLLTASAWMPDAPFRFWGRRRLVCR